MISASTLRGIAKNGDVLSWEGGDRKLEGWHVKMRWVVFGLLLDLPCLLLGIQVRRETQK